MVLNLLWLLAPFYKLSTSEVPRSTVLGGFSMGGHYRLDGGALLFVNNTIDKKNKEYQWSPG